MRRIIKIAEQNGRDKSIQKCQEEMGELITALAKFQVEPTTNNRQRVIEEISDTMITITQICLHLNISDMDLEIMKEYKINRTIARMEDPLTAPEDYGTEI